MWTPTVTASTREVAQALPRACQHISYAVDYDQHGQIDPYVHNASRASGLTELLIVDEADRLKTTGLEQVRDYYDRRGRSSRSGCAVGLVRLGHSAYPG